MVIVEKKAAGGSKFVSLNGLTEELQIIGTTAGTDTNTKKIELKYGAAATDLLLIRDNVPDAAVAAALIRAEDMLLERVYWKEFVDLTKIGSFL